MAVRIILRKDNVYDVYNRTSGQWLFSTASADNVFSRLSKMPSISIDFIDETIMLGDETSAEI